MLLVGVDGGKDGWGIDDNVANSTSYVNEEDVTLYDLFDYLDYTEDIENEYEGNDKRDLLVTDDTKDELPDELGSMDNFDQTAEESIQYNRKVPVNFLNISWIFPNIVKQKLMIFTLSPLD